MSTTSVTTFNEFHESSQTWGRSQEVPELASADTSEGGLVWTVSPQSILLAKLLILHLHTKGEKLHVYLNRHRVLDTNPASIHSLKNMSQTNNERKIPKWSRCSTKTRSKAQYIQTWSTKVKPPWTINIHLIKIMKGRGKNKSFLRVDANRRGWAQGKGEWRCIW
jgi:hypothetical protein